jgi:hypothetical protein
MLDVTIPDFHFLSTLLMVNNKATSLRAAIGNLRNLDRSLLHIDIDDATKNGDTIMIVVPQDMARAKKVIGDWILQHHKQHINWATASNIQSATHHLEVSFRTLAAGFATAFPPMVVTATTPTLSTAPHKKPSPAKPATKPPSTPNAWKSLSYLNEQTKSPSDTTTIKTEVSSSASNIDILDQHNIEFQLTCMEDKLDATVQRMNDLGFINYLQAS